VRGSLHRTGPLLRNVLRKGSGRRMIVVLWLLPLLLAITAFPRWPYSRQWGYMPSAGLLLVALLILGMHLNYMI
jgi:hypothetical protein